MNRKILQVNVWFDGASKQEEDATMQYIKGQMELMFPDVHRGIFFLPAADGSKIMVNCAAWDSVDVKDM